ncbi:hypothetical protein H6503_04520 [Candidatus Woesearchaeota archaeon]|nr:hypothetical protein [Candidatus Woesearchaeota archaeon]
MDEKFFIDLLNNSNYAILSLDKNLTVKFANLLAEDILEVHQEDLSGLYHPFDLGIDFFKNNNATLEKMGSVNFRCKILSNKIPVEGYIKAILNNGSGLIGYSVFFKKSLVTTNHNVNIKRKTFDTIRTLILDSLSTKRKTINQIAKDIDVNWRTVESHLTYLVGKRLLKEVLSSEYVRIFEISEEGKAFIEERKQEYMSQSISDQQANMKDEIDADYVLSRKGDRQ